MGGDAPHGQSRLRPRLLLPVVARRQQQGQASRALRPRYPPRARAAGEGGEGAHRLRRARWHGPRSVLQHPRAQAHPRFLREG